jgi:hypothetical protein
LAVARKLASVYFTGRDLQQLERQQQQTTTTAKTVVQHAGVGPRCRVVGHLLNAFFFNVGALRRSADVTLVRACDSLLSYDEPSSRLDQVGHGTVV